VGVVVTSVKKKLRGNAVELCRSIICKWKQLVPKPPANDVPSKPKQAVRVSPIPAGDTDNKDPQSDDKEAEFKVHSPLPCALPSALMQRQPNLPDKRKKAVDMLSQSLEDGTTVPEVAKSLAYAIEQAINDMHPHDTDSRVRSAGSTQIGSLTVVFDVYRASPTKFALLKRICNGIFHFVTVCSLERSSWTG
jgi:hypothetical protein